MKEITWLKAKTWWFKSGLILAFLHVVFMSWVIYITIEGSAQWQLVWILPEYVDFPISLLHRYIILAIKLDIFIDIIALGLFYLLVGTVWFFYLPILLGKISKKIATRTAGRVIAVVLMALPIFLSWLQIFRFYTAYDGLYYIITWTYYLICGLWVILSVWLLFVGSRRKVVLLLLCLTPLVFYYPIQDLYFYIKLAH